MGSRKDARTATNWARLARAYLEHKADLGLIWDDETEIVSHVDQITAELFSASAEALRTENLQWLERYSWLAMVLDDLMNGKPDMSLDG
jgi:hypothetical protein